MPEFKRVTFAVIIFCKCNRPDVELKLAVFTYQIGSNHTPHIIEGIRVIGDPHGTGRCQIEVLCV